MKFRSSYVLATVITLGAAVWLLSGKIAGRKTDFVAPAAPAAQPAEELRSVRVAVLTAEQRDEEVRVLGHTEATRKVDLRAEVAGRVVEVGAGRGSRVRAGDMLVRLASDDRIARLQESKALLAQRKIELDAAITLAERGHRSQIGVADAQAKYDSATAQVARMEVEVGRTVIFAPFDGQLEERTAELGSYAKEGDVVATMVDLDPVRVVGFVNERDVGRIAIGARAQGRLLTGREVEGRVTLIASVADAATRTFRIEVQLANPDLAIRQGQTAELRLPVGRVSGHRVSPAVLTLSDQGAIGVKLVDETDHVRFFPAQVLGEAPGGVWLGGLPAQARMIVVGQEFVREGQRVRPVAIDVPKAEAVAK